MLLTMEKEIRRVIRLPLMERRKKKVLLLERWLVHHKSWLSTKNLKRVLKRSKCCFIKVGLLRSNFMMIWIILSHHLLMVWFISTRLITLITKALLSISIRKELILLYTTRPQCNDSLQVAVKKDTFLCGIHSHSVSSAISMVIIQVSKI